MSFSDSKWEATIDLIKFLQRLNVVIDLSSMGDWPISEYIRRMEKR